jgi:hypothetical protein
MIIKAQDDIYQPREIIKTIKAIDLYSSPVTQFRGNVTIFTAFSPHLKIFSLNSQKSAMAYFA